MLLSNRRYGLIFAFLAGMEIAWFLPFVLWVLGLWQTTLLESADVIATRLNWLMGGSPLVMVLIFWLILLFYMFMADLLNQRLIGSPVREVMLMGTMLITTLLSIRLFLYPSTLLWDMKWLGHTLGSVFDFTEGARPELFFVLLNLFLWFRVALSTGRDLTFFGVGLSFRLGMLFALLGNSLMALSGAQPERTAAQYFWLFLAFGLAAVALARVDEKSVIGDTSAGSVLPWPRLLHVLLVVLVTVGTGVLLSGIYTPDGIWTFLGWFGPLWTLLGTILLYVATAIGLILAPIMNWMFEFLRRLLADSLLFRPQQQEQGEGIPEAAESFPSMTEFLQDWTLVRYCLVTGGIVIAVALVWLFFVKPLLRQIPEEEEDINADELDLGDNLLQRGLNRLRDLADLMRRYGLSTQLLAAISVQNMYANLSRLARQRGYPRHPAQPPDEYLPHLIKAFPTQPEGLQQITQAYMRVHYGDQVVEGDELAQLRADYERIKESPASIE